LPEKIERYIGNSFRLDLFIAKKLKKKLVFVPGGCLDFDLKKNISKYDNGLICENCGWGSICNDSINMRKFLIIKKYFDSTVGYTDIVSTQYKQTILPYKSLDMNLWSPDLKIPEEFRLPPTRNLRILHSFYNANRQEGGKNIKGSPYIIEAIERLKEEGYAVEYMYITDVPSRHMRYYQAQADIVVEQLIYGWWGSTGVETMALGKPVICYLREDAKENFFRHFPEYDSLPIIEANTQNIYEVLKKTVEDKEFRERKAKESREFAERFFDVEKNVEILEKFIMSMPGNSR
jgi:glycosyltransferase involved in cell wall biosynthesis